MLSIFLQHRSFLESMLVLPSLIFFHETGHFLAAKWIGLPVRVFSVGFGPRLFGFKWNETDVRLSLVPFGGYVQLLELESDTKTEVFDIQNKQVFSWKYLLFYSGGIIANILVSVVIIFGLKVDEGRITSVSPIPSPLVISGVASKSAAYNIGLKPRDKIHRLDNLIFPGSTRQDLVNYLQNRPGKLVSMVVEHNGNLKKVSTLVHNNSGKGQLGIVFEGDRPLCHRRDLMVSDFITGIKATLRDSAKLGVELLSSVGRLILGKVAIKEVGGPIAIVFVSNKVAQLGILQLLHLTSILSMQLAVINALPIPLLDGGHIAIFLLEKIRGKAIDDNVKNRFFMSGLIFLACITILLTILDVVRLFY